MQEYNILKDVLRVIQLKYWIFLFFFHRDLGANLLREIRTGVFQYLEDLKVL